MQNSTKRGRRISQLLPRSRNARLIFRRRPTFPRCHLPALVAKLRPSSKPWHAKRFTVSRYPPWDGSQASAPFPPGGKCCHIGPCRTTIDGPDSILRSTCRHRWTSTKRGPSRGCHRRQVTLPLRISLRQFRTAPRQNRKRRRSTGGGTGDWCRESRRS